MQKNRFAIILCGGSGKRLWPLSRENLPKQFLRLCSKNTLFQETLLRLSGIKKCNNPIIVCNIEHRFLVLKQANDIGFKKVHIVLEPLGRNTAPAITAASLLANSIYGNSGMLVLSADHFIENKKKFYHRINDVFLEFNKRSFVNFVIKPSSPSNEYGYLKLNQSKDLFHEVINFEEKPDTNTAKEFLKEGNYFWNCGIFLFTSNLFIDTIKKFEENLFLNVEKSVLLSKKDFDFFWLDKNYFEKAKNTSIDYALFEKIKNIEACILENSWADLGSWKSLHENSKKDSKSNAAIGDVVSRDSSNSYLFTENKLLITSGIDNLVVVNTPDVTFISTKDSSSEIKELLEDSNLKNRDEINSHRKIFRPWGWFDVLEKGDFHQVKKLHIFPGASLSLQKHKYRAEHWVVTNGCATVIKNDEKLILNLGDSVYIPVGTIHSLQNNTKDELEIIEIQSGSYLGEDDIERFQDFYGRIEQK